MATRRRVKPRAKNMEPIKDVSAVNAALAEIAGLKRNLAEIENELNEDIDRLKKIAEARSAPLLSRLEALDNGLVAYGEFNQDLFSERRSIQLTYGSIGFRRVTRLKPKSKITWERVLGKLREYAFVEAIRTKQQVNKEELEKWPDERLSIVGVERRQKDELWYEIAAEYLKEEKQ